MPVGVSWLQSFAIASYFHVCVDHAVPSKPPNIRTMRSCGSYAQPARVRAPGLVPGESWVHRSFVKLYFQVSERRPVVPPPPNIRNELSTSIQTRHAPSRAGGTVPGAIFSQSGKSPFRSSSQAAGPVPLRTMLPSMNPDCQSVSDVHPTESADVGAGRTMTRTRTRSATERPKASVLWAVRIVNPFPRDDSNARVRGRAKSFLVRI